ncbi:NADPH-dependent 7-cyano-7-deazaguanine reductase QueF [Orrella daihaiensis]|uniref:NADPH-dependent 7-cyano-7-deazaguanine reductase n=1 Tax=Orrella daihaiensis TaxID=2782176 RepID=A0ABY4ALR9_9BURK|nr:NADPH-dependent 7-cyano-7-deazaguanine reductase QueF [Orrella daihaiensis]UOD51207.1 NADPH-dependent 7-cyano-7-deazaguanine reductase QueF [Orrella daihaiensis]
MKSPELPTHDQALPLGKDSRYPSHYDPSLLYPIARSLGRDAIGLSANSLPFIGWDLWRGYELSWLNLNGLPCTAILKVWVPATSANIVESKSFKLYLNSLNNERFSSIHSLQERIEADIDAAAGAKVKTQIITPDRFNQEPVSEPGQDSKCLDDQDISINEYEPNPNLLRLASDKLISESVFSRLLKSNCPVTGQPDWGSLHITYRGRAIDHATLLRYIVSFRQHQGFHEQCVEQMFCDIMTHCQPQSLSIYARYTRRGGMDINPWRATPDTAEPNLLRSAQQ